MKLLILFPMAFLLGCSSIATKEAIDLMEKVADQGCLITYLDVREKRVKMGTNCKDAD